MLRVVAAGVILVIAWVALLYFAWDWLFPPPDQEPVIVETSAPQAATPSSDSTTLCTHGDWICSVAFGPDGKTIATGGRPPDPTIRFWNVSDGRALGQVPGHTKNVKALAFSPNGDCVLSCSSDGTASYWDVKASKLLLQLASFPGEQWAAAIAPDGRHGFTAGQEGVLHYWNLQTGQEEATLTGHEGLVQSVCFSRDGKLLLSCGSDRVVRLWDVERRTETARFVGHNGAVRMAVFSPDLKQVLSGDKGGEVILWDIATRQPVRNLIGHTDLIQSVAFLPDGKRCLTGGLDSTRLWDIAAGQEIRRFSYPSRLNLLQLSPDGTQFATVHWDGTLRLTPVPRPQ